MSESFNPLVVAAVQPSFARVYNDLASSREVRESILDLARQLDGTSLIVLPEYSNACGLEERGLLREAAEAAHGFLDEVSNLAREKDSYVLACFVGLQAGEPGNLAILFDPKGASLEPYAKLHLTKGEKSYGIISGKRPVIWDTPIGRVSAAICFDLYYPMLFESLRRAGVSILATPSYQRAEPHDFIRAQARMRAMDTGAFVVRASYDYQHNPGHSGASGVYAPSGEILSEVTGVGTCKVAISNDVGKVSSYRTMLEEGRVPPYEKPDFQD